MNWLWKSASKSTCETQTDAPAVTPNSTNIECIVRQLDRYGIAKANCPVGDLVSAYRTDFVFNSNKKDLSAALRMYTTALDFAKAWPDSSVLLITFPPDLIWESATSNGHPHNIKIILM